jgi:hypothetical protein
MSRALRIALMWLLTLAVPVQGSAAASMFNCGPGHHGKAQSQMHEAHAAHAHGDDAAVPEHHHHPDANAAHTDAGDGSPVHKSSCGACASCCTAAALPSSVVSFDAMPAHDVLMPLAPVRVAAFLTGGTERPPRPFLA